MHLGLFNQSQIQSCIIIPNFCACIIVHSEVNNVPTWILWVVWGVIVRGVEHKALNRCDISAHTELFIGVCLICTWIVSPEHISNNLSCTIAKCKSNAVNCLILKVSFNAAKLWCAIVNEFSWQNVVEIVNLSEICIVDWSVRDSLNLLKS